VPSHQFGKRRFRLAPGVIAQKLLIGQTVHSQNSNRRRSNRTGKGEEVRFDGAQFRRDIAAKALF